MVVGSAGVRGVLADGTFTLIRYAFLYVFFFFFFIFFSVYSIFILLRECPKEPCSKI